MPKVSHTLTAAFLTVGIAVSGCANKVDISGTQAPGTPGKTGVEKSFNRFPDLPMPLDTSIDLDNTLVFGGNDTWVGRLTVNSSHNANSMFDFYKQELPGFGWREITSIRSKISVLTYSREERIVTIQIQGNTLGGSEATLTVSPRGAENAPGGMGPGGMGPGGMGPGGMGPGGMGTGAPPALPAPTERF